MIALDASAVLALLFREPGHERVASALQDACISVVNLSEVLGRFARDGHSSLQVLSRLQATGIDFCDFDVSQAALASDLLPKTRHLGLSLGDRCCLALAASRGCPALTADAAWSDLSLGIDIVQIR